jgi:hypothetical protein
MGQWKGQARMVMIDFIGHPFVGQSLQGDLKQRNRGAVDSRHAPLIGRNQGPFFRRNFG